MAASSSVGLADHYGVLEVEREADETIVKRAYRRLVLLWHPDKHKENRDIAEDQIRRINDAYETLGNPFKRGQYDQQVLAMERRASGIRLDTTTIKPRMSIPKEFMMSPVGHPEKFVRTVGMSSVFAQARGDTKTEFYDFFQDAKFSLWWLPEVNNMCRLRPTSSAGVGQDGGLNFNFALHRTVQASEVTLSPTAMPESANVLAVASPVFKGAFRFEAAHFPGHYLAFKPPTHLRMVGGVVDETTAIDFMLVDYTQMFKYITAEEVLMPAVVSLGGTREYIPLNTIRGDSNVNLFFQNVLKKAVWGDDDFEYFFQSRSAEWDYDAERLRVRLRSKHEQLANALRRSRNTGEVAAAISAASEADTGRLPLETLEAVLLALGQPPPAQADVTYIVNILDAQKKVILGLPKACVDVSLKRLLSVSESVLAFGGENPDTKVVKWKDEAAFEFGHLFSDQLKLSGARDEFTLPILTTICQLPLPWRRCGERLAKLALPLLEEEPLEKALPLLTAAVKGLPSSSSCAERLANHARSLLKRAKPQAAAEALDAMVTGGLCLDAMPRELERVLGQATFSAVASILASLGERGIEGDDIRACAAYLGKERAELEALPPSLLLRLTVAATKSQDVAEKSLSAVAAAAAITLPGWTVDDAAKLLLAVAKAKGGVGGDGVSSLHTRASEVLGLKVKEFSSVQLIKVVLAIGKVNECRPLLVAAALELAGSRLLELQPPQLMLLTQGLLVLGDNHSAVNMVLDRWSHTFFEISRAEDLLTESMGSDMVRDRRVELEGKGQLTADQLAKLAQMVIQIAAEHRHFWKALATRFTGQGEAEGVAGDLTSVGKAALESAFPEGSGLSFEGKSKMLHVALGRKLPKEERERERQKEKEMRKERREQDQDEQRGREDRDRERDRERTRGDGKDSGKDRGMDKDRERDKNKDRDDRRRDKDRERDERGKDREREKEKGGKDREREQENGGKDSIRERNGAQLNALDSDLAGGKRQKADDEDAPSKNGEASADGKKKKKKKRHKGAEEVEEVAEEGDILSSCSSSSSSSDSSSDSTSEVEVGTKKKRAATGKKKPAKKKLKAAAKAQPEQAATVNAEEQEKRRLQRERRATLKVEESKKNTEAIQERRKKHRENLEKLKAEQKALEEKTRREVEAEAERRRLQRERRKGIIQAQVVELDEGAQEKVVELDD